VSVGGVAALLAFGFGWTWAGALAAMFAYDNAQRMRGGPRTHRRLAALRD
jgi:hypothetical protein